MSSKKSSKLIEIKTPIFKFANKAANIKYKKTYQFTITCKSVEVTHPKQHKSFVLG